MSQDSEYPEMFDAELALEVLAAEFETYALLSQINYDEFSANCHNIEPY